jgi:RNA polymerase primary sigma factor
MMTTREQAFELYLHDINDLPLLSRDDERRLVERMHEGRQAAEQLVADSNLSAAERERLQQAIDEGQRARDDLIAAHLRLVMRIARQYTSRGISLLDLIQEGNLALLQAAEHYHAEHGVRFATYATWWIRYAIARAIAEIRDPIRLPEDIRLKIYRLYRARNDLLQQLEREPDNAELGKATGLPEAEIRDLRVYLQPVLSLDAPINEEEDEEMIDVVPDPVAELHLSRALRSALVEELEQLLQRLPSEERAVITLRFGLHDQELRSRQEVAELLHTTTERVQRLEARALRKLRDPELLRRLQELLDQ